MGRVIEAADRGGNGKADISPRVGRRSGPGGRRGIRNAFLSAARRLPGGPGLPPPGRGSHPRGGKPRPRGKRGHPAGGRAPPRGGRAAPGGVDGRPEGGRRHPPGGRGGPAGGGRNPRGRMHVPAGWRGAPRGGNLPHPGSGDPPAGSWSNFSQERMDSDGRNRIPRAAGSPGCPRFSFFARRPLPIPSTPIQSHPSPHTHLTSAHPLICYAWQPHPPIGNRPRAVVG